MEIVQLYELLLESNKVHIILVIKAQNMDMKKPFNLVMDQMALFWTFLSVDKENYQN